MPPPEAPVDPVDPPEEAVPDPPGAGRPPRFLSAREAAGQGLPGWPEPGQPFPPPTAPVPTGRGGDQVIPRPLTAIAGGPAPWADLPAARRRPTLGDVRAAFAAAGPAVRSEREGRPELDRESAVLAPLYELDGELHVVLTRRTWDLRSHQGEVSFPGGRKDDEDPDLWTTARREAHEEIGLAPDLVERIGELDHLSTITSQSFIVPYVGAPAPGSTRACRQPG